MFKINPITKQMDLTRGDEANFKINAKNDSTFKVGDIVRFKVLKKKDCNCVVLSKDIEVTEETTEVYINLSKDITKIGDVISKDVDYWYEIELNPDTKPQTIVGYEIHPETGKPWEKIFKLLPEGSDE